MLSTRAEQGGGPGSKTGGPTAQVAVAVRDIHIDSAPVSVVVVMMSSPSPVGCRFRSIGRMEDARKVWATITRQGWEVFSKRDLWQRVRRSFSVAHLGETLDVLAEMGYVRRAPTPEGKTGPGRQSDIWECNPMTRTQNTHSTQKAPPESNSGDSEDSGYEESL